VGSLARRCCLIAPARVRVDALARRSCLTEMARVRLDLLEHDGNLARQLGGTCSAEGGVRQRRPDRQRQKFASASLLEKRRCRPGRGYPIRFLVVN